VLERYSDELYKGGAQKRGYPSRVSRMAIEKLCRQETHFPSLAVVIEYISSAWKALGAEEGRKG
jgi:hypothetical protein